LKTNNEPQVRGGIKNASTRRTRIREECSYVTLAFPASSLSLSVRDAPQAELASILIFLNMYSSVFNYINDEQFALP
jgi:hypothetical protein